MRVSGDRVEIDVEPVAWVDGEGAQSIAAM